MPPPTSQARRLLAAEWPVLPVLILLAIVSLASMRPGHDWGGDFAVYVMEARNIATHQPFNSSSYIATPESLQHHPAIYPPMTALVLAPVYALRGLDYTAFKTVLTIFVILSFPLYYILARWRGIPPAGAAAIVVIFGLCPLLWQMNQHVGSDGLFLFFAALALVGIALIYRRSWDVNYPVAAAVVTAVLLVLTYITRATGLALVLAFALTELLRARRVRVFAIVALGLTA